MTRRSSGLLLHVTSLPSLFGIGDLGPEAYRFVDFLHRAKQGYWQILPLTPSEPWHAHSPYSSISVFAGNPLLISPELLEEDGYLKRSEIHFAKTEPSDSVDYAEASLIKYGLLETAFRRFSSSNRPEDFEQFCREREWWLHDFALFSALKKQSKQGTWVDWPEEVRRRNPQTLDKLTEQLAEAVEEEKFYQFIFYKQWFALKKYGNDRGVSLIGDIPIYVDYDSVDVWANPFLFKLDDEFKPSVVAGVPPDYFSDTGQRWGNPVYDWKHAQDQDFSWWLARLAHNLSLYNAVRIDHFRGLVAYWEIPEAEKTAIRGRWMEAPCYELFDRAMKYFPDSAFIAEDLGMITEDVTRVMKHYGFPGMKVLLFAFASEDPDHPYLPHNYDRNCVVYTGTHDTNTARGWFDREIGEQEKKALFSYLGCKPAASEISWRLIRLALSSVANLCIIPAQDLLGLPEPARMNRPSTTEGNWKWRLVPGQMDQDLGERLAELCTVYGRTSGLEQPAPK